MAERRESVRLELHDGGFSTQMVKNAAATGLLEKALKSLDGTTINVHQRISESVTQVDRLSKSSQDADRSINQLTGRLRLFADAAAIFGPGAVPVGGVLAAGVAGFASQLGFAAVAGGVLAGSMQGLGDALGAMNKAQLEPTDKNLENAHDALKRLSPATRDFAEQLFALKPALVAIRDLGAESLVPGLSEAFDSIETLGPRVAGIFQSVAGALGEIAADSAASLASDRWADFFAMIEADAPQALSDMASAIGDVTHGLAEMWEAFAPLNADFSSWLVDVADGFDKWATGLSATQGFQNFVDYIRETGPQVAETAGALADAIVQIVQATAPLGGPSLAIIEAFANAIGAIADSDLGTPIFAGVAALAAYNRALSITAATQKRIDAGGGLFGMVGARQNAVRSSFAAARKDVETLGTTWATAGARTAREQARMAESAKSLRGNLGELAKGSAIAGAPIAGLAVASTGAADGLGLTNTATLALMGTVAGPWGAAIGAGVGLMLDWKASSDRAAEATGNLDAALKNMTDAQLNAQLELAKTLEVRPGFEGSDVENKRQAAIEKEIEARRNLTGIQRAQERAAAQAYAAEIGMNVDLATWTGKSTEQIKAQADAFAAAREAGARTAESFLAFSDSLNDSKVSLSDFITEMQQSANALANFNDNALKAASRGLDEGLIAKLSEAGTEGALRMKQLANATESEIARANAAHRKQQRELERTAEIAAKLAGYSPVVKVRAETAPAMRDIEGLEARLRAIRDEDVFINVRQINRGDTQLGPRVGSAEGGTVPKTGKPYADRHPYLLADGEEVISNRYGQADRYRGLLKRINANQRLADGGTAGDSEDKKKKPRPTLTMVDNTGQLERQLERLNLTLERQTSATDRLREVTDGWAQKMSDVARGTTSGFNSGLFDTSGDPWAAGSGGGAIFNLTKDIKGLTVRGDLQAQLADAGLNGDALAALLNEGSNADIQNLIATGQVSQYAALFNQRAALQGSVGQAAGMAAYGSEFSAWSKQLEMATREQQVTAQAAQAMQRQLDAATKLLERLDRDLPERTGAAVRQNVDKVADKGHRGRNR